ncbi:hypothetical protein ABIA33_007043 [Streptacidiphilus sp. MAP12-16]|uniref:hypothetical protein n=1 Tax=Streptacidiphilus sp. MAP12-16 TaxID=3156300 RepID=UPI003517C2B3
MITVTDSGLREDLPTETAREQVRRTLPGSVSLPEVEWDRAALLWRLTVDGEQLVGDDGQPLGWVRFSDAFDAMRLREIAAEPRGSRAGMTTERPAVPVVGSWVVDTRTDRVAIVRAIQFGRLYLRKPGGGTEWEAMPVHVRPATEHEALAGRVADLNQQSRFGGRA